MAVRGRVELADIFRTHGDAYLASHALARNQAKAWRAIVGCRTEALGGHIEQCGACSATRHVYHSCRNRHCPKCQTRAKEAWIAARHRELLPVPYTHLVLTIPHALNGLAGSHFDNANPGKKRVERLPAESFIARFLQHALPQGFKRIRHYGLLASCHKRSKLTACRLVLHAPEPDQAVLETVDAFMLRVAHVNITRCPHCASGVMQVTEVIVPRRIFMPRTTGPPS